MKERWGGSGIEKIVFDFIRENLTPGSTILELGSGDASTFHFTKRYRVYSVESDPEWVGRYPSAYIYAPIRDGWYDTEILRTGLPTEYDMIFVDGPLGKSETQVGRGPFLDHRSLFRRDVPIVFHDTFRADEKKLAIAVGHAFDQPVIFYAHGDPKDFWAVVGSFPTTTRPVST